MSTVLQYAQIQQMKSTKLDLDDRFVGVSLSTSVATAVKVEELAGSTPIFNYRPIMLSPYGAT